MSQLIVSTAATEYPVPISELRHQIGLTDTASDTMLRSMMRAGASMIEKATSRTLCTTTYTYELGAFPDGRTIELPRAPLASVTSVKYLAQTTEVLTTVTASDYEVHDRGEMLPVIELDADKDWPTPHDRLDSVQIIFVAGYTSADLVPEEAQQWIILFVKNKLAAEHGAKSSNAEAAMNSLIDSLGTGQVYVI